MDQMWHNNGKQEVSQYNADEAAIAKPLQAASIEPIHIQIWSIAGSRPKRCRPIVGTSRTTHGTVMANRFGYQLGQYIADEQAIAKQLVNRFNSLTGPEPDEMACRKWIFAESILACLLGSTRALLVTTMSDITGRMHWTFICSMTISTLGKTLTKTTY